MAWLCYDLRFHLQSPLHVGWRKSGNLQQTRGYVPGKNLWAALTARLTRDAGKGADGQAYVEIGDLVTQHFRFTYLYPAVKQGDGYTLHYPWQADFDYLFLDSYTSTALNYDSQSTEQGMLHETEFIAPVTREGDPVYLRGDLYVSEDLPQALLGWQDALRRLQFGGERGYGWGRVDCVDCALKGTVVGDEVRVEIECGYSILAHLHAADVTEIAGPIEPLIGWEWDNRARDNAGWRLTPQAAICYAPGATVAKQSAFVISRWGLLKPAP